MKAIVITLFALTAGLAAGASAQDDAAADPGGVTEPAMFQTLDAREHTLDEFLWIARPLVIFADTPADPRFQRQLELLAQRPADLVEREVVVIVDTDPKARSAIRTKLRPRGFSFVLIAKDGTVALRKPEPWHVREIIRSIDKMPLRQQEIREKRAAEAG